MIDLHLHLDGSLKPETVLELAKEQNISFAQKTIKDMREALCAPKKCKDLNEYLERFDIPLKVLQIGSAIERVTYELIKDLANQGLVYVEIRFAPQFSTMKGLSIEEVTISAINGLKKALNEESTIKANLILCCMRGNNNQKENIETINTAKKFLNNGVAAVDLAGAEAIFKTSEFKELFKLAKDLDIPFTIHAGEADGIYSVKSAIDMGAKRIGHGVRAREDISLLETLESNGITLEMCPASNIQTNAVTDIFDHPLKQYFNQGISVTINTDNMTVSNTTIKNEIELAKQLDFSDNDILKLMINSVNGAFISEQEKEILRNQITLENLTYFLNR